MLLILKREFIDFMLQEQKVDSCFKFHFFGSMLVADMGLPMEKKVMRQERVIKWHHWVLRDPLFFLHCQGAKEVQVFS